MNCDTAFEHLTDSRYRKSAELQQHLAQCPRCRLMQDTLAPALNWLGNNPDFDSDDGSPESSVSAIQHHHGSQRAPTPFLTLEAVEVAEQAAQRLSSRTKPVRKLLRQWGVIAAQYAVAMGIGGVLVFGTLTGRPDAQISIPHAVSTPSLSDCTRLQFAQLDFHAPAVDPKNVVMSCVACHLASR